MINKTSYNKLPKQYQKLLQDLKPEALASMKAAYKKADDKNLPMFKSKLKEIKYDEKTLAEFRKTAGKPVWDAWVNANKDKFDAQPTRLNFCNSKIVILGMCVSFTHMLIF